MCLGKFVQSASSSYRSWHFLQKDFAAEKSRIGLHTCSYCDRLGANLSCCHAGCKRSFHTKCGVDNLAVLQYGGSFDSFCAEHVPERDSRPGPGERCVLCLASIVAAGKDFSPALAFQPPCCQNGWFHRDCVQAQSISTTNVFRCPLCRNERIYANVAMFGIAIPEWRYSLPNPPAANPNRVHRGTPVYIHATPRHRGRVARVRIARLPN
ncbi:hypothetical protein KR054_011146 [Drosophila jambulina]|nr:hypothetical protein KR054_011146 [Drosophila jambulina]